MKQQPRDVFPNVAHPFVEYYAAIKNNFWKVSVVTWRKASTSSKPDAGDRVSQKG